MAADARVLRKPRPRMTADILRALAVTTVFDDRVVLQGVDIAVRRGEVLVVMGPSGCGKTTLLRHLCGLLPPTSGMVSVEGRDLYRMSRQELASFRLRSGLSFQGGALLGSLSVLENVALPLRENTDLPEGVILTTARMKLDMVGLLHAADLPPSALSGGMRKRAAIARAIALDPEIVFFDEPSAGLDPITAAEVDNLIRKLNQVFAITMVVVTHDLPSARAIADRVVMLHGGRVLSRGAAQEVFCDPDPRVRDFIERRMPRSESRTMDIVELMEI
ncbi:MAG: ATP-binding cassette domain-containing protein [Planctomycetota bacterium]